MKRTELARIAAACIVVAVVGCDAGKDKPRGGELNAGKPPVGVPVPGVAVRRELAEELGGKVRADRATAEDVGGAERYLTRVSTDKPIYRPGETVYVRGVVLNARDNTPLKKNARVNALVEIRGPKGETVASGRATSQDSVVAFSWNISGGQPGGEYRVRISYPWNGHAPAERKFDIRAYRAPRLKSQIVFLRKGYGPGDHAGASLHVERAEGGFPEGAKVTAVARVDGEEIHRGAARVDARGNCTVFFGLPDAIERGEGTLAMTVEDGGVIETATKTIPILLQTVDLNIYPEGGDLVAGLPNRVYVEAKTPAKKPADVAGVVVDDRGEAVASFRTEHEGRGRFDFTPRAGEGYTLRITEPFGIRTTYQLPEVKAEGAVLRALDERTAAGWAVRLGVGVSFERVVSVTLSKREAEVASTRVRVRPGGLAEVSLTPPESASGVLVATVWDEDGKPLAERLIYREPAESLKIEVTCDRESYVPGGTAKVIVKATDDRGRPVGAVVGVTVTDDSVLEMIEKREQAPRLPVMVLVEDEVRELADAHVYLAPGNPEAPLALDLLLGTQGWRRFAFVEAAKFIEEHGDSARRVLALRMAAEPPRSGRGPNFLMNGNMAMPQVAAPPEKEEGMAERFGLQKGLGMRRADEKAKMARAEVGGRRRAPRKAMDGADEILAEERLPMARERPLMAELAPPPDRPVFVPVRVYAHRVRRGRRPGDRVDFTETLYWTAGVRTDARTGEATVTFGLSDSVTTFRVFADGFSSTGALGAGTGAVESVEPFYIEPKLPLEVAGGDTIEIPVSFVNGTPDDLPGVRLKATLDGRAVRTSVQPFDLAGEARGRRLLKLSVGEKLGELKLVVSAEAGPYSDRVTRKLTVKPLGFPVEVAYGGVMEPDGVIAKTVDIPGDVVPLSARTDISVYPTPLANLTEACKRLMREPCGCFEQTSSTTYPLVMAQQYFTSHAGVDPALVERSNALLSKGYKRLVGFECKTKGYEWFGGDPGHEALTAYGLLEFTDMSRVREVDATMLGRTREWLLARRDGKGGFARNKRALDSFGRAPGETTDAYIVWALLEGKETGLEKEIEAVRKVAASTKDSYVLALAANVLALDDDAEGARKAMKRLVAKQAEDGRVEGAVTSITRSGGQALKIETTSLAVLAWLRDREFAGSVEKGVRYIVESCKGGRYGSTQSTVLALRAIVAYDKSRARPKAAGRIRLYVDGRPSGGWVSFDEETQGAIGLPDVGEVLEPGRHRIELRMEKGSAMPYSFAVNYNNMTPASSLECKVGLKVSLADDEVSEGGVTEANVVAENLADEAIPMPVAIVGLPGGLEPRHDQLKELVKAGRIDAYEVIGREVVLYWRQMLPREKRELPLSLVAAVPGVYAGPASRAYLYYTDEFKTWVEGARVAIAPRAQR